MPVSKKPISRKRKIVKAAPNTIVKVGESQMKGFLDFIRTQGVVRLAVGLVLGGAVGILVKSFVNNIIMPPIGLLLGSTQGLNGLVWTISVNGKEAVVAYGVFLNDFINFLVIALVIYYIIHLLRLDKLYKPKN